MVDNAYDVPKQKSAAEIEQDRKKYFEGKMINSAPSISAADPNEYLHTSTHSGQVTSKGFEHGSFIITFRHEGERYPILLTKDGEFKAIGQPINQIDNLKGYEGKKFLQVMTTFLSPESTIYFPIHEEQLKMAAKELMLKMKENPDLDPSKNDSGYFREPMRHDVASLVDNYKARLDKEPKSQNKYAEAEQTENAKMREDSDKAFERRIYKLGSPKIERGQDDISFILTTPHKQNGGATSGYPVFLDDDGNFKRKLWESSTPDIGFSAGVGVGYNEAVDIVTYKGNNYASFRSKGYENSPVYPLYKDEIQKAVQEIKFQESRGVNKDDIPKKVSELVESYNKRTAAEVEKVQEVKQEASKPKEKPAPIVEEKDGKASFAESFKTKMKALLSKFEKEGNKSGAVNEDTNRSDLVLAFDQNGSGKLDADEYKSLVAGVQASKRLRTALGLSDNPQEAVKEVSKKLTEHGSPPTAAQLQSGEKIAVEFERPNIPLNGTLFASNTPAK